MQRDEKNAVTIPTICLIGVEQGGNGGVSHPNLVSASPVPQETTGFYELPGNEARYPQN